MNVLLLLLAGTISSASAGTDATPYRMVQEGVATAVVDASNGTEKIQGSIADVFDWLAFQGGEPDPVAPNLGFEQDQSPRDGVPDGWLIDVSNGAGWSPSSERSASGDNHFLRLTFETDGDRVRLQHPLGAAVTGDRRYRLTMRYRFVGRGGHASERASFSWRDDRGGSTFTIATPRLEADWNWHEIELGTISFPSDEPLFDLRIAATFKGVLEIDDVQFLRR